MLICEDCFAVEEIRYKINEIATSLGHCDVCGDYGKLCDLNYFIDFFREILHLFEKTDKDGLPVVEIIQNDWNIFNNKESGYFILREVISHDESIRFSIDDKVRYIDSIKEQVDSWDRLKKQVKEETRFFADVDDLRANNILEINEPLKEGHVLYRARIIPENCDKLAPKEMGCPQKEKTPAGRANPLGIPYLYLCDDIETTYYEVRAVYLDRLAIGSFVVQRQLSIVNFHYDINLYIAYSDDEKTLEEVVVRKKIIDAISTDLSRPLRRYDSEIEYIPTQLICEYCKRIINADGISFESSLRKGHTNYVIFDQRDAKCTKVDVHEIQKIEISKV